MEIFFIIAFIIGFIFLNSKINNLEAEIAILTGKAKRNVLVPDVEKVPMKEVEVAKEEVFTLSAPRRDLEVDLLGKFFKWLAKDWLVKLGGFIVLLGVIFFLSIAYNNVGDIGKVSIGFFVSGLVMVFGFWRALRSGDDGLVILVLGGAIATYVAYTAVNYYELISFTMGLAVTVLLSVLITFVAVKFKSQATAFLSSVLLFASPLIFASGSNNYLALFTFLLFATLATIWVVMYTGWISLQFLSLAWLGLYGFTFFLDSAGTTDMFTITMVSFVSIILHSVVNVVDVLRKKVVNGLDILLAVVTSALILFWVYVGVAGELKAIVLMLWSVYYIFMAAGIFATKRTLELFYIYATVPVVFIFIAFSYLLDGNSLTLAYIMLGILSIMLTHIILRDFQKVTLSFVTTLVGIFHSVPLFMSSVWDSWQYGTAAFPFATFAILLLQGASLLILGIYFYLFYEREEGRSTMAVISFVGIAILSVVAFLVFGFGYKLLFTLSISYILLSILAYASRTYFKDILEPVYALNFIPVLFSFPLVLAEDVNIYVSVLAVIILTSLFALLQVKRGESPISTYLLGAVSILSSLWIWEVLHFVIPSEGTASLIAVSIYAIVGYAILYLGYKKLSHSLVRVGQIILGLVAFRVLFVDAWSYGVEFGVFICMVVGAILIATTFIVKDIKLK